MSRKIKVLLTGALLVASSSSAFAAGPYISAAGGATIIHNSDLRVSGVPTINASFDTGFGFNLNGGYNFDEYRIEGEFGYKSAELKNISAPGGSANMSNYDTTIRSFMINGYIDDIIAESAVTPYIGAGIGVLNGEIKGNGYSVDDTVPGYQLIAGVGVGINKNITLDISYRFQHAPNDFEKNGVKASYLSSNVFAGMRWNF